MKVVVVLLTIVVFVAAQEQKYCAIMFPNTESNTESVGTLFFTQFSPSAQITIRSEIKGLPQGLYALKIHDIEPLTMDCGSLGQMNQHIGSSFYYQFAETLPSKFIFISPVMTLVPDRAGSIVGCAIALYSQNNVGRSCVACGFM